MNLYISLLFLIIGLLLGYFTRRMFIEKFEDNDYCLIINQLYNNIYLLFDNDNQIVYEKILNDLPKIKKLNLDINKISNPQCRFKLHKFISLITNNQFIPNISQSLRDKLSNIYFFATNN